MIGLTGTSSSLIASAILVEGLNLRYEAVQAHRTHHATEAVRLHPALLNETAQQPQA